MGLGETIADGIDKIADAGKEIIDHGSIDLKIADKRRDITKIEERIGHIAFQLYCGDKRDFNEDMTKLCDDIRRLLGEIFALEEEKKSK